MPTIQNNRTWQPKYNLEEMGLPKLQYKRHYKMRWFTGGFWRFHFQNFLSFLKLASKPYPFIMWVEVAVKGCPIEVMKKLLIHDDVKEIPTPDEYKF